MDRVIKLLNEADRRIKKRHRYFCGLESPAVLAGDKIHTFFQSPDGQNGELYYELRRLGLVNAGFSAPYYWKVREKGTGWVIAYTEGDVDIYQLKNSVDKKVDKIVSSMVDGLNQKVLHE